MHDEIFGSQNEWAGNQTPEGVFAGLAEGLELDKDQFVACLEEGTYADTVQADYQEGLAEGVTGTPAFRINGVALSGAQPFAALRLTWSRYSSRRGTPCQFLTKKMHGETNC